MKFIKKAIKNLEKKKDTFQEGTSYIVPDMFQFFPYQDSKEVSKHNLQINPYDFYASGLQYIYKRRSTRNYLQPISLLHDEKKNGGNWIKKAFVYSSMVRTSSSYDHDQNKVMEVTNHDGFKESGTFLKQIFILPYLKEMGIDTLYLLPFFKTSEAYKKGDFGSSYAISNPMALDENLYDPMLDEMTLEEQAKAFFEACHFYDIRVIMDIIPRTSARDSVWVEKHPDWFYWIQADKEQEYALPYYDMLEKLIPATKKHMEVVYTQEQTREFLKYFQYDPKTLDEKKYKELVKRCKEENTSLLDAIKEEFNLVVAPAFSDWINDPQPVWSDVTYLRMYLDNNDLASCHVANDHAPYLLFDSAKSSLYPCQKPNQKLWDQIANIVPYYQKTFGIDGVRIDMGHTLPLPLVQQIISKARDFDPNICFIDEELDIDKAAASKKKGYNVVIGNGFSEESRIQQGKLKTFYTKVPTLACPVFGYSESHDTCRVTSKPGKKDLNIMLTAMNLFFPNTVAFLNSGQELFEIQPMNLGLDCDESERYNLPESDPRYNKLALFDPFYFTYNDYDPTLRNILIDLKDLRHEYIKELHSKSKNMAAIFRNEDTYALGSYLVKKDRILLVVANTDLEHDHEIYGNLEPLKQRFDRQFTKSKDIYSTKKKTIPSILNHDHIFLPLKKGEVRFIEII